MWRSVLAKVLLTVSANGWVLRSYVRPVGAAHAMADPDGRPRISSQTHYRARDSDNVAGFPDPGSTGLHHIIQHSSKLRTLTSGRAQTAAGARHWQTSLLAKTPRQFRQSCLPEPPIGCPPDPARD